MLPLFAPLNSRDLGGIVVAGGHVRQGVLYRSQGPKRLTGEQSAAFRTLALKLICDLRSPFERSEADFGIAPSLHVVNCDIRDDFGADDGMGRALLRDDPSERGVMTAMTASYVGMVAALHPFIGPLGSAIAAGELPALIHCTAGKDRTGVMVALLLALLGASREAIVADYLLSAGYADRLRAQGALAELPQHYGIPLDARGVDALVGVRADYVAAALDRVDREWGSIEGYFETAGVDADLRRRMRANLTEPT